MATLVNVNGGYSTKKESKVRDSVPADWQDFLAPYARYTPLLELYQGADPLKDVDPEALKELWTERDALPSVFFMTLDWNAIKARVEV